MIKNSLQVLENRYIDGAKLENLCRQRFAPGTYSIEARLSLNFATRLALTIYSTSISNGTSTCRPRSMKYEAHLKFLPGTESNQAQETLEQCERIL